MKQKLFARIIPGLIALSAIAVLPVSADDSARDHLVAGLSGFNEVPTLSTPAQADFRARIKNNDTEIEYTLTYSNFPTNVAQSHIHLGRRAVNGGVMVFLCTNLGNGPAGTPACPNNAGADGTFSGTVTGTLTAASVVGGAAAQGVVAGEFDEVLAAIRAGATYANVHSAQFPAGEVRAQVRAF
ncbi:MAG: CHRD domain-containing protein [Sulfurifustaceae bacterium]